MNLNLAPTYLAEIFGFSGFEISPLLVPIAAIVLAGVIVVSGMYFTHQRRRLWHETARLALEKGQPLPPAETDEAGQPAQLAQPPPGAPRATGDFRAGLILVGTGAGLYLFLGTFLGKGLGYVGAIPGFIGVALLLHGLLSLVLGQKKPTPEDLRPKS